MNFNEYIEDVLDLHAGLMSEEQFAEARKSFEQFMAPKKASETNPEMKKPVAELRARCERMVIGQSNAIARVSGKPEFAAALISAKAAVAEGKRLLSMKRATKAEFIAHAEQNSAASRVMNAVK